MGKIWLKETRMPRRYSEHPLISSDIEKIYQYIADESSDAAMAVVRAIYDTLHEIERGPERFPEFSPETFRNERLYRAIALPYRNYLIFFEITPDETRILYVHHSAGDFEKRYREGKRT